MQKQTGTVAFYRVATEGFKIQPNQAYLYAPKAANVRMLSIGYGGDGTTAINGVEAETTNTNTQVYTIDGKKVIEAKDRAKSKASLRTLPLVPAFREKLLEVKKQQEEYKRLCGRSYCKDYLDYICVDPIGERISPNYITAAFPQLLVKNGLRRIRFHDLRHSCASLLLANGVPMKQIQEWLGHSDFSTTANFYAHLEYQSKMSSASAMMQGVDLSGITEA